MDGPVFELGDLEAGGYGPPSAPGAPPEGGCPQPDPLVEQLGPLHLGGGPVLELGALEGPVLEVGDLEAGGYGPP